MEEGDGSEEFTGFLEARHKHNRGEGKTAYPNF